MYSQSWQKFLEEELALIKAAGRYKEEVILLTPQGVEVKVRKGERVYDAYTFCANNYLGLAADDELIAAAIQGMIEWGHGMASVRFICGTQQPHKDLEKRIAEFLEMQDSIIFTSCFDTNGSVFAPLLGADDAIITDELNHRSIIEGVRLCKAQRWIYKHNDMRDIEDIDPATGKPFKGLERCLKEARKCVRRLLTTDGVFSMDGEIAKLREICDLAEKYEALVLVDDSHATGFLGERGRGSIEYCGVMGRVDIVTSTFGKALGGGIGGFAAGPREVIDDLRQQGSSYIFSNSLLPAACASALKVFDILDNSADLRQKLMENTRYFREGIKSLGFEIKGDVHPIVPVMIRDSKLAQEMATRLLENGVLAVAFSHPVVPKNEDRIRVQISAAHEKGHLDFCLNAFYRVGKELKII